jgi:phosphomannomutase
MGILDREVFEQFPEDLSVSYLFEDLDGNFPNHEANPLKTETLEELSKKVMENKADLGVAYDGDADRVGFVDEKGEIVPMDFTTALIGKEILKSHPGGLILVDLRSSNAVKEFLEESGGKVEHCRVGHSLIKSQMRKEGAVFAGELSGHYFFEENFKAEMPTLAVIMILNLIKESGKTMSELAQDLRRYYHSGEINSDVIDKEKVFNRLKEKYADGELNEMDGLRIDYSDWWFNVRASNTEPKVRLNLEAKNEDLMEKKKEEILKIIRSF